MMTTTNLIEFVFLFIEERKNIEKNKSSRRRRISYRKSSVVLSKRNFTQETKPKQILKSIINSPILLHLTSLHHNKCHEKFIECQNTFNKRNKRDRWMIFFLPFRSISNDIKTPTNNQEKSEKFDRNFPTFSIEIHRIRIDIRIDLWIG